MSSIKSGVTTIAGYEHELSLYPEALNRIVKCLRETGVRFVVGYCYQDNSVEIEAPETAVRDIDEIINGIENVFFKA